MKRALVAAIKSPASGRQIFLVCLNCAQAIAPDWPLLVLWPFLKLTLASSAFLAARTAGPGFHGNLARSLHFRTYWHGVYLSGLPTAGRAGASGTPAHSDGNRPLDR